MTKLDPTERARDQVLANLKRMTKKELFALAVRAGILTKDGKLTKPYRTPKEEKR